jgi:hypothetical protein
MFNGITDWMKRRKLEKQIAERLTTLIEKSNTEEELSRLIMLKEKANQTKKKSLFTPDTLLIVGGNLVGIWMILKFEKFEPVVSKAFGQLLRGRL